MKLILLYLIMGLCLPRVVGSANYYRIANCARIVENRDGKITVTERSNRFKKLYYFISKHPAEKNPIQTTELLYNCPYPEAFAAIASVESEFKRGAIGKDRERTIFQILNYKGNPLDNKQALATALQIFEEKKSNRSFNAAIKAYNGRGSKAERYKRLVLKKISEIRSTKI